MKLYISQIDKEIPFLENFAQVLIIEKRELFSDILMSFWKQCNGEEGTLILSEDDKVAEILAKHKGECLVFMSSKDIYNIANLVKGLI